MSAKRKFTNDKFLKRAKQLALDMETIIKKEVVVGIVDHKASSKSYGGATVGQIGRWHEYGVPKANLPKRSFLHEPLAAAAQDIEETKDGLIQVILKGNKTAEDALALFGVYLANISKLSFDNNDWAPLKPATLAAKNSKRKRKGKGSSITLVDTGLLKTSITSVVRDAT